MKMINAVRATLSTHSPSLPEKQIHLLESIAYGCDYCDERLAEIATHLETMACDIRCGNHFGMDSSLSARAVVEAEKKRVLREALLDALRAVNDAAPKTLLKLLREGQ